MSSFLPILVSPLPSGPWHLAQFLSQVSFTSAAEADRMPAAKAAARVTMIFFMIYLMQCLFRILLCLRKELFNPCFQASLKLPFSSHLLLSCNLLSQCTD